MPPTALRTACNRDCPDACSIIVTVDEGRAIGLRGDPSDPITRGFLCERTNHFLHRQYSPDRFTEPMVRHRGRLQPIPWDEALDLAASKLLAAREQHGPASILHYRSGGSLGLLKHLSSYLFEQFGPVTIKRGDICSGAGEAAQRSDFGISESHGIDDLGNSQLIILWGKNPYISGPHLVPYLNAARRRGARIVGVDPVRTRVARESDLFLCPRPGADFAVAMAIARRLFDLDRVDPSLGDHCTGVDEFRAMCSQQTVSQWCRQADVPVAQVEELADDYSNRKPAAMLIGWGLGRRRNGAQTVRALDALAALTGNLGIPGGGASYYFGRRAAFDVDFISGIPAAPRTFAEARLGEEIRDAQAPEVRCVWVTAGNPVSMLPASKVVQKALLDVDFTVVVDTHPTDTTDCADLVLPTMTLLEDDDLLGAYGNHYLRVSRPTVPAPPGVRHELEILQGLAKRLGLGSLLDGSPTDWKKRMTTRLSQHGVDLETIEREPTRNPFAEPVLFTGKRFPTTDGKAHLLVEPALPAPELNTDYPLTLLATSTPKAQSSQWAMGPPDGPLEVRIHPAAAAELPDGTIARLESRHGSIRVRIAHDPAVRRDIALLAKGGMMRDGQCANELVAAVETDDGGGAAYYDEAVRLLPA